MTLRPPRIAVSEVTDPDELRRARERDGQFDRNLAWFRPRAAEIYAVHRGKHLCVSGQELFSGDSPGEVLGRARAAHPEDEGRFILYVPKEALERISAARRAVVSLS